jgi:hypothetical protein
MLDSKRERMEKAMRNAGDRFARAAEREAQFRQERQKRLDADASKTAKLRTLRLAKEAVDKEVQEKAAADKRAAVAASKKVARVRVKKTYPPAA